MKLFTWQIFGLHRDKQHATAQMRLGRSHIHPEDLERYALGKLDETECASVETHISRCGWCREYLEDARCFAQALKEVSASRRSGGEPAYCNQHVDEISRIKALNAPESEPVECRVRYVSSHGMVVTVSKTIDIGSQVNVRVANAMAFGVVRHARETNPNEFHLGITIDQVVMSEQPTAAQKTAPGTARQDPLSPGEILIVEDNPADAKLTRLALEKAQLRQRVTVVNDGREALNRLFDRTRPQPELVLLDLNLPKVTGFEVLRMVHDEEALSSLRIAILSCSAAASDVRQARDLGVAEYFQKPQYLAGYDDLAESIRSLISANR